MSQNRDIIFDRRDIVEREKDFQINTFMSRSGITQKLDAPHVYCEIYSTCRDVILLYKIRARYHPI